MCKNLPKNSKYNNNNKILNLLKQCSYHLSDLKKVYFFFFATNFILPFLQYECNRIKNLFHIGP